eukprot:gene30348-37549_t
MKIAQAKADALMTRMRREGFEDSSILITTDQIVLYKQAIREKPENEAQAIEFLSSYSNDSVTTLSAVVITHFPSGIQASNVDLATVYWKYISDEVVQKLVAKGDVLNTAGGFMIEDVDLSPLIKGVDGSMDSVFGMPVDLTERLINEVLAKCDDYYANSEEKGFDPATSTPTRYTIRKDSDASEYRSRDASCEERLSSYRNSLSLSQDDDLIFGGLN